MHENFETVRQHTGTAQKKRSLLEQITAYVEANLAEKITLKMIANQFSVSVSTVTQLFQKKTETTFHHFVTCCRMEKARTLILQGLPLESVGKAIGYQDHSTFYRAYLKHYGCAPSAFVKERVEKLRQDPGRAELSEAISAE